MPDNEPLATHNETRKTATTGAAPAPVGRIVLIGVVSLGLLGLLTYLMFPAWPVSEASRAASAEPPDGSQKLLAAFDKRLTGLAVTQTAINTELQTMADTLGGVKASLEQLDQRVSQQLDTLATRADTQVRAADAETHEAIARVSQQLSTLQQRLTRPVQRAAPARGSARPEAASLRVTKVERWGGQPNVFVEHARFGHRLRVGERVAGWTLKGIVDEGDAVMFQKGDATRRVAVGG